MVLGGAGLTEPLCAAGIEIVPPVEAAADTRPSAEPAEVDAVFVGWFREFTMSHLEAACQAVWDGAALYSASETPFFAAAGGTRALGTSRAITAMIRSITGCRPVVTGKPSRDALRAAAARLKVPASSLVVVGDDPLLEVPMAHRGRALAVAVQTGLAVPDAFDHLPPARRPHLYLRGVDELLTLCQNLL
jgi:4-nitrophenyl phosphatase